MKRTAIDRQSLPVHSETIKDKRTLVLFLLGLTLIFHDFWPNADTREPNSYSVVFKGPEQPFQVLSLPATAPLSDAAKINIFNLTDQSTTLPLVPTQDLAPEVPASLALFFNRPLPINRADKTTLVMLPGVGPYLADAILTKLQRHGRLTGPEDLLEVSGIGPRNMQRLLPLISFE